MSRDMLTTVGAGALSGFASLAFLSGIPGAILVVYFAPLPLLLIGLDLGIAATLVACLSGIIITALAGNAYFSGAFAIIHAIPAFIIVRQAMKKDVTNNPDAEEWYPIGSILCMLSVFIASLLVIAFIWSLGEVDGLKWYVQSYLNQVFNYLMPLADDSVRIDLIKLLAPLFPGYMGMSWAVMAALNASIAMTILTRTKRTKRPKIKIADLNLPDWMSWFFVIAAIIALLGGGEMKFLGQNLALILATPFFFLGLAVVHNLARYVALPGLLLTTFYLVLILSGWIALAVMAAGIIEQWIGLRRYFGPKKTET